MGREPDLGVRQQQQGTPVDGVGDHLLSAPPLEREPLGVEEHPRNWSKWRLLGLTWHAKRPVTAAAAAIGLASIAVIPQNRVAQVGHVKP